MDTNVAECNQQKQLEFVVMFLYSALFLQIYNGEVKQLKQ